MGKRRIERREVGGGAHRSGRRIVVALDGPASSGKSTVGAAAARQLGLRFLDTGLLYRALTWLALERGVDPAAPDAAIAIVALVPALQHPLLLTIHVGLAMLSYGIFAFAFAAAVAHLAQGAHDRYAWLPPAKRLDLIAFRAVTLGFPLFAGMLILGSIWASIAWSSYWGWDPKETSALATWLVYAVYLHARSQRGWQGRPAALLLVLGFVAVLLTYSGNLWFSGLHTYSGL